MKFVGALWDQGRGWNSPSGHDCRDLDIMKIKSSTGLPGQIRFCFKRGVALIYRINLLKVVQVIRRRFGGELLRKISETAGDLYLWGRINVIFAYKTSEINSLTGGIP